MRKDAAMVNANPAMEGGSVTRTTPIPRRRSKPRRGPLRDRKYLRFLRYQGFCVVCFPYDHASSWSDSDTFARCLGTSEDWEIDPCHGPVNGMGSKGPDNEAVPMCRRHHRQQTRLGWECFEHRCAIDRKAKAAEWWEAYQESKQ